MSHSIYWLNKTTKNIIGAVYHDLIKRRYFSCKIIPGSDGEPYRPFIQSMYYTIRIYDEKDENCLHEYQYVCVEKQDMLITVEEVNNEIKCFVSYYPFIKGKRPVYVLGGQCNNIEDIDETLNNGANGMECDIWVDENDNWWVNHNENKEVSLDSWLQAANNAASKRKHFTLIVFDTKKVDNLKTLYQTVSETLTPEIKTVFSVSDIDKAVAFEEIIPLLNKNQGLAIDEENNVDAVVDLFKSKNVKQFWYGNGIFAGGLDSDNQHQSLNYAGELRDKGSEIKKTYIWTIESKETIISYLYDEKVDGIITNAGANGRNFIDNALDVINHSLEFRLATREDDIFKVFRK